MGSPSVVRGVVVDRSGSGDGVPARGHACLTSGHELVAEAAMDEAGAFVLTAPIPADGPYQVAVFAGFLEAWRRTLPLHAGEEVDLGRIDLQQAEYPPGIHGHFWDVTSDQLVFTGRVLLDQAGQHVASATLGLDGAFAIPMSCRQPLPPGAYELVAEAPGYDPARVPVTIADEETTYQLGRIELVAAAGEQGAGG